MRRQNGYDTALPGNSVVIHKIATSTNNSGTRIYVDQAQVMSADSSTTGTGAMWTAGETFRDDGNGTTIHIDSSSGSGAI